MIQMEKFMNIYDIYPDIEKNCIFSNCDQTIVKQYLCDSALSVAEYSSQYIIFSPDIDEVKVGIVLEGKIEIAAPQNAHKVLLKTAGRGSIFGIANLYAPAGAFPTQISAKTDVKILFISPSVFRKMLEADIALMKNFLSFLSGKIVYLNKKIVSYTAGNTEQKLAYFIYENSIDGLFSADISISDIAVMLDMGRASLYRSFDNLEAQGIIKRQGRKIEILDKQKLKKIYTN